MLSPILVGQIAAWATAGFPCVKTMYVYRYQPAYPNTFVKIWVTATIGGVVRDWVCQDVHYDAGGAVQALGGFWLRGVVGSALPQQEWRNNAMSPARAQLYNDIIAAVPAAMPDKTSGLTWAAVMEYLNGIDVAAPVSG